MAKAAIPCLAAVTAVAISPAVHGAEEAPVRTNVLLITLDDMGFGSTGVEGCKVPGITPNIDRLAGSGTLFTHGYVMTPICGPSRGAMLSGRYPHNSGMLGHGQQPPPDWKAPENPTPTISRYLRERGYLTAAILKRRRNEPFNTWDIGYDEAPYGVGRDDRNPEAFHKRTKDAIKRAREAGKPFFIYANPIDPHMPWVGTDWEKEALAKWNPANPYPGPGVSYRSEEMDVPAHLPDLPGVRRHLVPYYEAVHRGDACIGEILRALDESGLADETLVIFLSDHGMGAIGAKAMLYHHGLRTPVIIRWPGRVPAGRIDRESIVSAVDIFPTIIEALEEEPLEALDGRSFLQTALGKRERTGRRHAYAAFNYYADSVKDQYFPQRAIIDADYCYIWNAYVTQEGGDRPFLENGWKEIVEDYLNDDHPRLVAKVDAIVHKVPEELFDLRKDPGCWNNLIDNPAYAKALACYRDELEARMRASHDPELANWPHHAEGRSR